MRGEKNTNRKGETMPNTDGEITGGEWFASGRQILVKHPDRLPGSYDHKTRASRISNSADGKLMAASPRLLKSLRELLFVAESAAHLQGLESQIMPAADKARALIEELCRGMMIVVYQVSLIYPY